MANPVIEDCTFKTLFERLLPNDFTKFHTRQVKILSAKGKIFERIIPGIKAQIDQEEFYLHHPR